MKRKHIKVVSAVFLLILFGLLIFIGIKQSQMFNNNFISDDDESGLIAYVEGHRVLNTGGTLGGDVWLYNPTSGDRTRITEGESIQWVHDWSPDNKKIAVIIVEKKDSIEYELAFVDFDSGAVTKLNNKSSRDTYWYSNNEITYLNTNEPDNYGINVVNVDDLTHHKLINISDELLSRPQFSQDKQWVAAGDSLFDTGLIYSLDVNSGKLNTLTTEASEFGVWHNNNIIYATYKDQENGIWEIDPSGVTRKLLVDLGDPRASNVSLSKNGKTLAYVANEVVDGRTNMKMYSYDYLNNKINGPYVDVFNDKGVGGVGVSKDGRFVKFNQNSAGVKVLDLDTNEIVEICDSVYCNAAWSN